MMTNFFSYRVFGRSDFFSGKAKKFQGSPDVRGCPGSEGAVGHCPVQSRGSSARTHTRFKTGQDLAAFRMTFEPGDEIARMTTTINECLLLAKCRSTFDQGQATEALRMYIDYLSSSG